VKILINLILLIFSFSSHAQVEPFNSSPVKVHSKKSKSLKEEDAIEDKAIIEAGPIGQRQYITAGITGSILGFGSGHVLVGKWRESGWMYTAGEVGFLSLMVIGYKKSIGDTLSTGFNGNFDGSQYAVMITGYVGFISTKLGEIFDIWTRPYEHNQRYKELTKDNPLAQIQLYPVVAPSKLGLGLAWNF
jgi:hypothetical protein